jgi:hypothetical protein
MRKQCVGTADLLLSMILLAPKVDRLRSDRTMHLGTATQNELDGIRTTIL